MKHEELTEQIIKHFIRFPTNTGMDFLKKYMRMP